MNPLRPCTCGHALEDHDLEDGDAMSCCVPGCKCPSYNEDDDPVREPD